jgi:2-polyprenyl-6-methoxyphenol hydroxylase-like FAD-dependent oxidoreductase
MKISSRCHQPHPGARSIRPLSNKQQRVLVVGAGIAGSGTAFMLAQSGYDVTVVDAAKAPYEGGYQILLDPTALTILDHIGALDLAHELSAPDPLVTLRRNGKNIAEFGMKGYRMARRGDLVGQLSRRIAQTVPMEFGKELVGIEQRLDSVRAHFSNGTSGDFAFIVGADGLNSTVRRLALESERSFIRTNGRICLWVNVPGKIHGPTDAAVLTGNGLGALVFPYPDKEEMLVVTTMNKEDDARPQAQELLPRAADFLASSGSDLSHLVDGVRHASGDQVRVTAFAQVRAPQWHSRRVILIGDAAHCIDPLSGLGAHGGLLGGSILAQELRRTPQDLDRAAIRYQRRTRKFVQSAQHFTSGLMELSTANGPHQYIQATAELALGASRLRPRQSPPAPGMHTRPRPISLEAGSAH